jgi:hypothetical protein
VLCKLCQQGRPLRRSHIFPELLYRRIYGPKHTIVTFDPSIPYPRKIRRGLTEPLLCDLCEKRIQKYEDYFARFWFLEKPLAKQIPTGSNAAAITGLGLPTVQAVSHVGALASGRFEAARLRERVSWAPRGSYARSNSHRCGRLR